MSERRLVLCHLRGEDRSPSQRKGEGGETGLEEVEYCLKNQIRTTKKSGKEAFTRNQERAVRWRTPPGFFYGGATVQHGIRLTPPSNCKGNVRRETTPNCQKRSGGWIV